MLDTQELRLTDDGFIFKRVYSKQAKALYNTDVFSLYILHDDGSESLIENDKDLLYAVENGLAAIEVGSLGDNISIKNKAGLSQEEVLENLDFTNKHCDVHLSREGYDFEMFWFLDNEKTLCVSHNLENWPWFSIWVNTDRKQLKETIVGLVNEGSWGLERFPEEWAALINA